MKFASLLLLLTAITAVSAATPPSLINRTIRYDNHMVLQVARTPQVIKVAQRLDLDIWGKSTQWLQIRLSPEQYRQFMATIPHNTPTKLVNSNIQKDIDAETALLRKQLALPQAITVGPEWHKAYHTFDDIAAWVKQLSSTYSDLVTLVPSIGKTHENRDIPMVRITSKTGGNKASILVQSMQHAREWISGATGQYFADALASGYASNPRIKALLDKVEFYIIPVCNPDGYVYSWTTNRMQRKNRAVINGQAYGVDTNRNWPDHWGQGGSSSSPSSDTYMGPKAGSEPEVQALMKVFKGMNNVIAAYDIHSFSQLILRPAGWTQSNVPDDAALAKLGEIIKSEIAKPKGTKYTNQRVVDLYVASGGSNDWWYGIGTDKGKQKVYGMALELPPAFSFGGQGFILPPENIVPVGQEITNAMLAAAEHALANPLPTQQ